MRYTVFYRPGTGWAGTVITVTSYSLCTVASILAGTSYALWLSKSTTHSISRKLPGLLSAGILGARILYCIFHLPLYNEIGFEHMLFLWEGGYALWGAIAGCTFVFLRLTHKDRSWKETINAIAPAFPLTLALCRFSEVFSDTGSGEVIGQQWLQRIPFSIQNAYGEWRGATFLFEGVAAIFIWLYVRQRKEKRAIGFLLLFSSGQVFLESLRCDDYLRILFVRVSQVIAALVLVSFFAVRLYGQRSRLTFFRFFIIFVAATTVFVLEYLMVKSAVPGMLLHGGVFICSGLMTLLSITETKRTDR